MDLNELSAVPSASLPVQELADHLRLGSGFTDDGSEDTVLEAYLRAALSAVESRTGKAVFTRRFSWTLYSWNCPDRQGLPIAPVALIESVTLTTSSGSPTVVDPAQYRLIPDSNRPVLRSNAGLLPNIPNDGSVTLIFEAGFGPAWDDIPAGIQQAIKMLAAIYFDYRHGVISRNESIPLGIEALLQPHMHMRLSGRLR